MLKNQFSSLVFPSHWTSFRSKNRGVIGLWYSTIRRSLYELWKEFDRDHRVAGACGEITTSLKNVK